MHPTFDILLDLPNVTIKAVKTSQMGNIQLTIQSTIEGIPCHQCGQITTKFYDQDREIVFRHLPILGRKTYLHLRPQRYHSRLSNFRDTPEKVGQTPRA